MVLSWVKNHRWPRPAIVVSGGILQVKGFSYFPLVTCKELVVYDEAKCLDILVKRDGMTLEEAREFFEFNTAGAWGGEGTPMFLERMTLDEIEEHASEGTDD